MKDFLGWTIFGIFLLIGLVLGHFAGDALLEATQYASPRDVIGCRIGFPLGGGAICGFIGLWLGSKLIDA